MKLICGDCVEILKFIPDNSIDLIVTDVPYKIVGGGDSQGKFTPSGILSRRNSKVIRQGKMFEHNDIEFGEYIPDLFRVLKDNTHCYLMINGRNLKNLQIECENAGFIYQNLLVWVKNNATPNQFYMNCCEFILMLRKGAAKHINNRGSKTVININNIKNKKHPTEKPVELMKIMIENSSNVGDNILDPFMGSGSTGVACKHLNRNFIGIEKDKQYYNIAVERIINNGN